MHGAVQGASLWADNGGAAGQACDHALHVVTRMPAVQPAQARAAQVVVMLA